MIYEFKNGKRRLCEGYIIRLMLDNPQNGHRVCAIGEVVEVEDESFFVLKAWYSSDVWYENPFNQEIKLTTEDLNELNAKITVLKRC